MSLLGQSVPKWAARPMSGLPPIATEERTSREVRKVPKFEVATLPRIPHHALAGVARGDAGELALEGGGGGPAVQPFLLDGGGHERGIPSLRGAVDDKGCARQRLERRPDIAFGVEIVRPCHATSQSEDAVLHRI